MRLWQKLAIQAGEEAAILYWQDRKIDREGVMLVHRDYVNKPYDSALGLDGGTPGDGRDSGAGERREGRRER